MRSRVRFRSAAIPRSTITILVASAFLLLLATLGGARAVMAGEEMTIDKYVAAVNDEAPVGGGPVSVVEGDSVAFGLNVSSSESLAGTGVTMTDVFGANELEFQNADIEGCTEQPGTLSCALDLDETGGAVVILTFTVLAMPEDADGCATLLNEASLESEDGSTATSSIEIEVCPPDSAGGTQGGSGASPAPSGESGAAAASPAASGPGASGSVDTAVSGEPGVLPALLVQLGILLACGAALALAHVRALRRE